MVVSTMKSWREMTEHERDELIAEKVLGWVKKNNYWYDVSSKEERNLLPPFSTDDVSALLVLKHFDSYQVTKMFPNKYRTIIQSNKNFYIASTFAESICRASLKVYNIET